MTAAFLGALAVNMYAVSTEQLSDEIWFSPDACVGQTRCTFRKMVQDIFLKLRSIPCQISSSALKHGNATMVPPKEVARMFKFGQHPLFFLPKPNSWKGQANGSEMGKKKKLKKVN